ncbi:hypothetical protein JCM10450v2_002617 [Rhodotorula kratochvilovae]
MFLRRRQGGGPAPTGGSPALASGPAGTGGAGAPQEWHAEAAGERYYGLENSLYFSKPFRHLVESYYPYGSEPPPPPPLPPASPDPSTVAPSNASLPSSSSSSGLSALSSAGRAAKAVGNALSTPYVPTSVPPTARRSPPARQGAGGGGRGNIFSPHRRQSSVADSAASSGEAGGFTGGASLAHQTTNSSFTGVGTPVVGAGGALAREVPTAETTLLTTLRDLFCSISGQQKSLGTVAPQAFINQLKRDNEFFRSTLHQDAHEFLNFLINSVAEALERDEKKRAADEGRAPSMVGTGFGAHAKTWVHSLFEGILTNETRCLTCETVTSRDEAFLDLSIDIEQNSSVTACLRQFSASEMLCQRNKFSCDKCCGLQEAEKRMKIKKLPNILALHLKRFKYEESLQRHVKLTYRVVFPFELRLFNTADDVSDPDRLYELWAIVVHIGVGPHHGHYITIVKSGKRWVVFDDNNVYPIEQHEISRFFGDTPGSGSGYVLFYQAVDIDWAGLELPIPQTPSVAGTAPRERAQTASSVSTGGLAASWVDEGAPPVPPLPAAAIPTPPDEPSAPSSLPPSSPPLSVPAPLVNPTAAQDLPPPAASPLSSFGSLPLPPPPGPAFAPQQRKASLVSLSGSSVGTPELGDKERKDSSGGWSTLRGKFGRTKSHSSATKERRMSLTPGSASLALPSIPSSEAPSEHLQSSTVASTDFAASPNGSSVDLSAPSPPAGAAGNGTAHAHVNGTPPAPPSEDGSASVASSAAVPQPSPRFAPRRNSRASFGGTPDLGSSSGARPPRPPGSSASSASLSSSGVLPPPLPLASHGPTATPAAAASTSAFAKTRGFLSRNKLEKPRPATAHAPLAAGPNGVGLGLSPAPGVGAGTAEGRTRLSSAPALEVRTNGDAAAHKRPSTASPIAGSASSAFPVHPSRVQESGAVGGASPPLNGSAMADAPPAPVLSRKEQEKRIKEEQKAREKEAKARDKAEKERQKQLKDDAKRQEKLRRKMSIK